jgi:transcriptional regulator with XRE-family HTH domain
MSAFGDLLKKLIGDDPGVRGFAEKVGISHSQLSLICSGKRTPSLDKVEDWATKLGLTGRDKSRFLNLAALAHLPPEVEGRFVKFLEEHEKLLVDYQELAALVKRPTNKRG